MIALYYKLLFAVGLGRLSPNAAAHVLQVVHTMLDFHVATVLSAALSPRQRAEIAEATRAGDECEVNRLLSLLPNSRRIGQGSSP